MVLGAFMVLSWGASHFAHRLESTAAQYAAFAVFVVAWSLMFVPMLALALAMDQSGSMIQSAAGVTVFGCVALIATVMITRKDFSFLRGVLVWGFFIARMKFCSILDVNSFLNLLTDSCLTLPHR